MARDCTLYLPIFPGVANAVNGIFGIFQCRSVFALVPWEHNRLYTFRLVILDLKFPAFLSGNTNVRIKLFCFSASFRYRFSIPIRSISCPFMNNEVERASPVIFTEIFSPG